MSYDLRREAWIPWRRRSGEIEWGPPAALMSRLDDDPVVGLAAPRPDFDGALQEFLIGFLTVALRPADEAEWRARWQVPPGEPELALALGRLPDAFDLDGDGPRFCQDLGVADLASVELGAIEQLLIDAPGDQTQKLNKDLFAKRGRVEQMGSPAAAMALLTLQTYAPSGGQGHRTSMRGGGPLTTLVDPRTDSSGSRAYRLPLWQKLWANVETLEQLAERTPFSAHQPVAGATFPWLAVTRTSEKTEGVRTTPADGNPLQVYFGAPRRIRLEFGGPGACSLTGQFDNRTVVGFRMRNYGVQYEGWRHPLSPYYRQKSSEPWLPVHPQAGGIAWRDWLSLTLVAPAGSLREPARTVSAFAERRARAVGCRGLRLHVFGYDMDNMKARGWADAVLPILAAGDQERQDLLYAMAAALTEATGLASTALLVAVKAGLLQKPDDAPGDFSEVKQGLWSQTATAFYAALESVADPVADVDEANDRVTSCRQGFRQVLTDVAIGVFDHWCPAEGPSTRGLRRRVAARRNLLLTLSGRSKLGEQIFRALGIVPPGAVGTARSKSRKAKEGSA